MRLFTLTKTTAAKAAFSVATAALILPLQVAPSFAQATVSLPSVQPSRQVRPVPGRPVPNAHTHPHLFESPRQGQPNHPGPIFDGNGCPEGTYLVIWDKPIYDEAGLFVVDHEPTPICVDEDTQPAG